MLHRFESTPLVPQRPLSTEEVKAGITLNDERTATLALAIVAGSIAKSSAHEIENESGELNEAIYMLVGNDRRDFILEACRNHLYQAQYELLRKREIDREGHPKAPSRLDVFLFTARHPNGLLSASNKETWAENFCNEERKNQNG